MTGILLTLHVITAILAIGPVAVAGSMFPTFARTLARDAGDTGARSVAGTLHRICRVYSILALAVPAVGMIAALPWQKLDQAWLLLSIALTAAAAALLAPWTGDGHPAPAVGRPWVGRRGCCSASLSGRLGP